MPRKAQVEGARAPKPKLKLKHEAEQEGVEELAAAISDGTTHGVNETPQGENEKAWGSLLNTGHPNPVPGDDGEALDRIATFFQKQYPLVWAEIALCPTQHGLEVMANTMRGNG